MECCLCVWILTITISVGVASATSSWTEWTACSKTCGGGTRSRNCVGTCSTEGSQTDPCNTQGCTCQPGDVRWQEWKEWSACSMTLGSGDTCGNGFRTRLRMCYVARRPTACKSDCSDIAGTFSMEEPCVVCCDDNDRTSNWGDWLQWGQCSVTCGQGERSRSRTCNPPNVNEAGSCASTCVGDATQFDDFCLGDHHCCASKDKVWGSWQPWSSCSAICGEGSKARSRPCVNPDPPYDCTVPCSGLSGSAVRCSVCCEMLASTWRAWSEWTTCVRAVGFRTENKSRGRSCRKPDLKDRPPGACAEDCPGDSYETVKCPPTRICEDTWLEWGEYGQCSEACGAGVKSRSRRCRSTLCICRGEANDTIFCSGPDCLGTGENVSSTPDTRGDADQHNSPPLRVGASSALRTAGIVVASLLLVLVVALGLTCELARRQRSSTKRSTVPGVLESTERGEYPASYASQEEYPVAVGTLPKPPRPSLRLPSYGFPPAGSARRSLDGRSAMTHPSFQVNYFPSDQNVVSCVDPGSEADESSTQFSDGSEADDVSSSVASSYY